MNKLKIIASEFLIDSNSDGVAIAVIDFKKGSYDSFECYKGEINTSDPQIYFDYASLTKPLTNSMIRIAHTIDDEKLDLILNHRAGIPSWGLLPRDGWREQILSYEIKESPTEYSDYSALRYMLEVEKKLGTNYQELIKGFHHEEIKFWKDLSGNELCLQNGFYGYKKNIGKVHDPNAYNLNCFTSHAGLFGTIRGLAETLVRFEKNHNFIALMEKSITSKQRYIYGFDTVEDPSDTLAGKGCSITTFGHLGFTGTSFWIDAEKEVGHVILTNSKKYYWYDKKELNQMRRAIGEMVWLM